MVIRRTDRLLMVMIQEIRGWPVVRLEDRRIEVHHRQEQGDGSDWRRGEWWDVNRQRQDPGGLPRSQRDCSITFHTSVTNAQGCVVGERRRRRAGMC